MLSQKHPMQGISYHIIYIENDRFPGHGGDELRIGRPIYYVKVAGTVEGAVEVIFVYSSKRAAP